MFFLKKNIVNIGPGEDTYGPDAICLSSHKEIQKHYDLLIFSDSKGVSSDTTIEESWVYKIASLLDVNDASYFVITRPKNLTVFCTLLNFLRNNANISFNSLVTNVGFVDFTPKKKEFIEDIKLQAAECYDLTEMTIVDLSKYELSSGEIEELYSFNYGNNFKRIASVIDTRFNNSLLIETFEFTSENSFKRKRPVEFYERLSNVNEFIENIKNGSSEIRVLRLRDVFFYSPEDISFDAVHFKSVGHDYMFDRIREELKKVHSFVK